MEIRKKDVNKKNNIRNIRVHWVLLMLCKFIYSEIKNIKRDATFFKWWAHYMAL